MRKLVSILALCMGLCICIELRAQVVNIDYAEYFIDTDPGFGLGTSVSVTPSPDVNPTFNVDLTGTPTGLHLLNIRTRDSNFIWSHTKAIPFYSIATSNPNVVKVEYFIDTDPGFGLANAASVSAGTDVNTGFLVNTSALNSGIHMLNVRVQDENSSWGHTKAIPFYVISNTIGNISGAEYFFDVDPGTGAGTSLAVTPGTTINESYVINTSGLSTGLHIFNVRIRDDGGQWGLTQATPILNIAISNPNIVTAEYFFDTDPGPGLGTTLAVSAGTDVNESYVINTSGISTGLHIFNVRMKDAAGNWSLTHSRPFLNIALNQPDITEVEYFFDADPGPGNGSALTVTPGTTIDESYAIPTAGISTGLHIFNVRTKSASGDWSLTESFPFLNVALSQPDIVQAEYFFDTDPGQGSGSPLVVTPGPDINENYSISTAGISTGMHIFNIRTKSASGQWSLTQSLTFLNVVNDQPNISRIEYYVDADPGFGLATPVAFTPDADVNTTFMVDTSPLPEGMHYLHVRSQATGGDWSTTNTFIFTVIKDVTNIIGIEYAIDTDPGPGSATYVAISPALNIVENFVIPLDTVAEGNHKIFFRTKDGSGNWSLTSIFAMQVCNILPPVSWYDSITTNSFRIVWPSVPLATQYHLDVSADNFISLLPAYNDKIVTDTTETIKSLLPDSTYHYRIRSEGYCLSDNSMEGVKTYQQTIPTDSLVLVDIYNTMNGPNWAQHINWFTGPVASWNGVTVAAGHVTMLDLSNDGLTGSLPSQVTTLDSLSSLNILFNDIVDIPDLSSLPFTYLNVAHNRLTFEDIEPNISIPNFTYAGQQMVGVQDTLDLFEGDPFMLSYAIGGSANLYQWQRDSIDVAGETATSINRPAMLTDNGKWHLNVTNSIVSVMYVQTANITVNVIQKGIESDSLSLVSLYNSTGGPQWKDKSNWLTGLVATWFGVTVSNNKVTQINLHDNNLTGIPNDSLQRLFSLVALDLSANNLNSLPNLTGISTLTSINVSGNRLDFAPLEQNISLVNFSYGNQQIVGTPQVRKINAGSPDTLKAVVGGLNNLYQWKYQNANIAGATGSKLYLLQVDKSNIGIYTCEITNSVVTGLTLTTAPIQVIAVADISGKLYANTTDAATKGKVTLFRITATGGYDTLGFKNIANDGSFTFNAVTLDNYQLLGFADTITYPNVLPTFYKNTLYWEEADTIKLTASITGRDIKSQLKPGTQPAGHGLISGVVLEEIASEGRILAPKRVANAGVSVRRVERSNRGKDETLTLTAYAFTNSNGEFEFTNLDQAEYRLNVQYPGYPMDSTSQIDLTIGSALESEKHVEAKVEDGQINVRVLVITGIWEAEGYRATVFPNPAKEKISLHFENQSSSRNAILHDITGSAVITQPAHDIETDINVQTLPAGIYLLTIEVSGKKVKTLRVEIR
jgi:Leucine-rich repeat (LRR) protein